MEILIYGLKQGETRDYMEDLLACFPKTDKANPVGQGNYLEDIFVGIVDTITQWVILDPSSARNC